MYSAYANKTYLVYMGLFLIYPVQGLFQNTVLSNEHVWLNSTNLLKQFLNLLKEIHLQFEYDYIVLVKNEAFRENCLFDEALAEIEKPIMILSNLTAEKDYQQRQHSTQFLILSCSVDYINQSTIFDTIYQYNQHIIWWKSEKKEELQKLCFIIQKNGYFKNLILTYDTLERGEAYFTCDFQNNLQLTFTPFSNPFLDLKGQPLVTEADQLLPRSILYYDKFGRLQLTGFIGNYLTTFAQRLNATLVVLPPKKIGVAIHYDSLVNKTFKGLVDLPAIAAPLKMISGFSDSYSYPIEFMEYCYMIPLPHFRPAYHVYFDIIEFKAIIIIILYSFICGIFLNIGQYGGVRHLTVIKALLNDKSVRGLLCQSFVMPKKPSLFFQYICFLLCYSSLLLSTTYQAYLQTHLVHPALEKRMETYEDIRQNNYKILVGKGESQYMSAEDLYNNRDIMILVNNFDKFLKLRDNMDVRYIYPVSRTRWIVYKERQKLFQRKLFYYSENMCVNKLVLLSVPLRPGLPYKALFNQHLMTVRDTGLLDHWLQNNFLTMVRLNYSSFKDLSVAEEYGDKLLVRDLLWIWILYVTCNLISLLVFIVELLYYKKCSAN